MIASKKVVRCLTVIAICSVILALILGVINLFIKEETPKESDELLSSNQMLLGYKKIGDVRFDYDVLKKNVMGDDRFSGYVLRDNYCMVYQVTDHENEKTLKDFLGIKEELPKLDYSESYMLLSVGSTIEDMSDKYKKTTASGEKIVDLTFNEEYSPNTVYVYSMKKTKFLSGTMLEIYYLENIHPNSNLEEDSRDETQLVSEGKYHRIYKKAEDVYEFVLYTEGEQKVSSRRILDVMPIITEYNDSMVRLEYEDRDQYYNPQTNFYTTRSKYKLNYLRGNIVVFVKESEYGMINLIVRDVYNTANYSYILSLPYGYDGYELREFLHEVEYVDSTHIKLGYYFGESQPIKEDLVTVPNLDKNLSGN